jgi:hypothetical protein
MWKGQAVYILEGLKKTTKNLWQDSPSPSRYLNPRHQEYKREVAATRPRRYAPQALKKLHSYRKLQLPLLHMNVRLRLLVWGTKTD